MPAMTKPFAEALLDSAASALFANGGISISPRRNDTATAAIVIGDISRSPAAVAGEAAATTVSRFGGFRYAKIKIAGMRIFFTTKYVASVAIEARMPPRNVCDAVTNVTMYMHSTVGQPVTDATSNPPTLAITAAKPMHNPTETMPVSACAVAPYRSRMTSPSVWQFLKRCSRGARKTPVTLVWRGYVSANK